MKILQAERPETTFEKGTEATEKKMKNWRARVRRR
jgi:hypothetical protein